MWVKTIEENAFGVCPLEKVNILDLDSWCNIDFAFDSNPLTRARHLYLNDTEIIDLVIPNTVNSIRPTAFSGCYYFNSVSIPKSVTKIESNAFHGCKGITSLNLSNGLTDIGEYAFDQCEKITSLTIPNSVTIIGPNAFADCKGLTTLSISNSATIIDVGAFYGCVGLTSVVIPHSVANIEMYAFKNCSKLKNLELGSGLKTIGNSTFADCKNLEEVTCYAEDVPSLGSDVFMDSYVNYATLKVPEASIEKYKAADQWKDFGNIIAIESTEVNGISVESAKQPVKKYIENGKVLINNGKDIYNTAGQLQK